MSHGPVRRLFRIFDRPPTAADAVDLEIRHHIESRAEELMKREGLSADAALDEARRRFGELEMIRRRMEGGERRHRRDMRRLKSIGQTGEDIRFALRGLRKSPGLAAVVIITLALGIGLNTAIFSVVKGVLLDPLPYPEADRLVWGVGSFSANSQAAVSPPDYLDYRDQSTSFEYLGGRRGIGSYTLTGSAAPEVIRGQSVTAEFFEALGGVPILGRGFTRTDEQQVSRIVVLGHTFWQNRLGGRSDVVGERLTLDGESHEIVGVMPAGFQLFSEPDFFSPIPLHVGGNLVRRFHNLRLVGRLQRGVSIEEAQAELDVIASRLEREYPESNATWTLPIVPLESVFVGGVRTGLMILWGAVGMVLLIVCANVANLLLARGTGRRVEIALRTALGAGRARIMRLLFTESLVLALVGCAGGVGLSFVALRVLRAVEPGVLPRMDEVALDGWVLAFTIAISLLTGLVFGLFPALATSNLDLSSTLKTGGRGAAGSSGRIRGALVVAEVAMSFVLLIGAGLLIQSFAKLRSVDPGFQPDGMVVASVALPEARYQTDEQRISFFAQLRTRLAAMPGVEGVATSSILPLSGGGNDTYVGVPGRLELGSDQQFNSQFRFTSNEFFDVMRIPLIQGRAFGDGDRAGSPPVVVIDQTLATAIFPDENPLGQRLQIDMGEPYEAEIIGVVGGISGFSLALAPGFHLYLPYDQRPIAGQRVVIRTTVDPVTIMNRVAPTVAALDPLQPVSELSAYSEVVDQTVAQPRFQALLLGIFAAVALVLAVIGVYGVLSYLVAQRAREVGIRIALGARRSDVVRLIVRRGLGLTMMGLAIGLVAAFGLTRLMATLLFGVGATDVLTFALVAVLLGGTSLAASYVPARRAARVDPTAALRQE